MVGNTNGALARYSMELRSALRGCNGDKAGLRAWVSEK